MTKRLSIKEWKEDERPREKLLSKGAESLSDAELLAIILGFGTKEESAVDLGRKILQLNDNNLRTLASMSVEKLMEIKGVGTSKALSIVAVMEINKRVSLTAAKVLTGIQSSQNAAKLISPILRDLSHEECWVLYLNRANKLISKERLSIGGLTATVVDVKIVIKGALEKLASSIILVHNHPSGNLKPSQADLNLTKKLVAAGQFLDLPVIDHIIMTKDWYLSFADEGLM